MSEHDQSGQISGFAILRGVAPSVRYLTPLILFATRQAQRVLDSNRSNKKIEGDEADIAEYDDWRQPFYKDSIHERWHSIAVDALNYGVVASIDYATLRPRKKEMVTLLSGAVSKENTDLLHSREVTFRDLKKSANPFVRFPALRLERLMRVSALSNLPAAIGAILPFSEEMYRKAKGMDPHGLRLMPDDTIGTNAMVGTTVVRSLWEAVNGESRVYKNILGLKAEADRPIESVKSDILEYLYNSCVDELVKEQNPGFFGRIRRAITKPFRRDGKQEDPVIFWEPQHIDPSDKYTKGMLAYMAECLERTQKQRYDLQGKHLSLGFDEVIMLMPWINKDAPKVTEYVIRSVAHGGYEVMPEIRSRLAKIRHDFGSGPFDAVQRDQLAGLYERDLREVYSGIIGRKLAEQPAIAPMIELVVDGKQHYTVNVQQIAELIGAERVKYYLLGQGSDGSSPATVHNGHQYYLSLHDFLQLVDKVRGRANEETNSYDTNKNPMLLMTEQERSRLFDNAIIGEDGSRPLVPGVVSELHLGIVAGAEKQKANVPGEADKQLASVPDLQNHQTVTAVVDHTELTKLASQALQGNGGLNK
ncbi:hypothetical protein GC177_00690 [bacterium]|nr:hypothetical protein [bacterium]